MKPKEQLKRDRASAQSQCSNERVPVDLLSPNPERATSSHEGFSLHLLSLQHVALTTPDMAAAVVGFCQGPGAEDVAPTQKQTGHKKMHPEMSNHCAVPGARQVNRMET